MKKKKIILALIIIALVAGGVYFFLPNKATATAQSWTFSPVTSENIVKSITATGTIEPVTSVDVGTQVSGIVTTVYVDYNSVVKKGQVIAELDKSTLTLDLDNNKFSLAEAQAELDYETANYTRVKALYENKLVSSQEYEAQLYTFTKAKNSVESAKISVQRSEINLGYATIYSPIDGVVLSKDIEEGQTVASSYSTPTLFTVAADLTDMRVIADIDEADIGEVREGLRVSFTVDAYINDTFEGIVTQVRQEATIESNVVTYEVVISAANPDLKLKPGLTASVEVFTLDLKCDAVVPASALTFDPGFDLEEPKDGMPQGMGEGGPGMRQGGGPGMGQGGPGKGKNAKKRRAPQAGDQTVWVKRGDKIIPHAVKTDITNGILTQVVEGVIVGDTVATGVEYTFTAKNGKQASSPFVQQRGPGR
ncbi:MAG: efflux RND transporter periplasmic adaptor subunit [Rikenellaceae bacterium]